MLMTLLLFIGCCALMVAVSLSTRKAAYEEDFSQAKQGEAIQKTSPLVWLLFGVLTTVMAAIYVIFN